MKVATAIKIRNLYGRNLGSWAKSDGGYFFGTNTVYLTVGSPLGIATVVNLDTIQAKMLSDCRVIPFIDELLARNTSECKYPAISLGDNFLVALERTLKIISSEAVRNYGQVALVRNNGLETKIVATDSFVLYEHTENVQSKGYSFCIGVKEVKAILAFFVKTDGPLVAQLSTDKTILIIEQYDKKAFIALSQIKYPNYLGVLPEWTKGHKQGTWNKKTPKVKGSFTAIYERDKVTYIGKNSIRIGSIAIEPIVCSRLGDYFTTVALNPNYIAFVNDSKMPVEWHQSVGEPSHAPLLFRSASAIGCTETTAVVPIAYSAEDITLLTADVE